MIPIRRHLNEFTLQELREATGFESVATICRAMGLNPKTMSGVVSKQEKVCIWNLHHKSIKRYVHACGYSYAIVGHHVELTPLPENR